MNKDNTFRAVLDTKDTTAQFALLKIDEYTFSDLQLIKKYGNAEDLRLAQQGLADAMQCSFNEVGTITPYDSKQTTMLARNIYNFAKETLRPAVEKVLPKYSHQEEANGWNAFIRQSLDMEKIRIKKGTPIPEWEASLTIRKNSFEELKKVYGDDIEGFVQRAVGEESEYYFGDKWFVVYAGVPHSEDAPNDLVNHLLNFFQNPGIIYNAWQDWMFTHRKELEGKK